MQQELALHGQLSDLTARLTAVAAEAARLREDREELQYQLRHLHDTLAARAGNVQRVVHVRIHTRLEHHQCSNPSSGALRTTP